MATGSAGLVSTAFHLHHPASFLTEMIDRDLDLYTDWKARSLASADASILGLTPYRLSTGLTRITGAYKEPTVVLA